MLGEGDALLTESELAATILNIFNEMCIQYPARGEQGQLIRPAPRVKRLLCQPDSLPHIVQLLLTFDVTLVEKAGGII
jgi:DnaJ family protein C protein 13